MCSGNGNELTVRNGSTGSSGATGDIPGSLWASGNGFSDSTPERVDRDLLTGLTSLVASQLGMRLVFIAQLASTGDRFRLLCTHVSVAAGGDSSLPGELSLSRDMLAAPAFIDHAAESGVGLASALS